MILNKTRFKVNINLFVLYLLIIAVFIPDYWFVQGHQVLNLVYLLASLVFLCCCIKFKNALAFKYLPWLYILSLLEYGLQAIFDASFVTGFNYIISTALVIICVHSCVKTEERFLRVIDVIIYLSIPFLILGFVECITKYNLFQNSGLTLQGAAFYKETRLGIFRIAGVYGHPIVYCNFLSMLLGLILYRQTTKKKGGIGLQFIYLLALLNCILTVSRSVLLVIIMQQVFLQFLARDKLNTRKRMIGLSGVLIALVLADSAGLGVSKILEDFLNMLLQIFGLGNSNYNSVFSSHGYSGVAGDRILLYTWVILAVGQNRLFGVGTNGLFTHAVDAYRTKRSIENFYLHTFFRHGLVGLVALAMGYFSLVIWNLRSIMCPKLEFEKKMHFPLLMIVIILGEILQYFMVDQSGEARLLYILIGLLASYHQLSKNAENRPAKV